MEITNITLDNERVEDHLAWENKQHSATPPPRTELNAWRSLGSSYNQWHDGYDEDDDDNLYDDDDDDDDDNLMMLTGWWWW